ncbi:putative glycoside hydrolase [Gluconacetobacter azotocaptans]|uniref:putative glycoside hydrolase n=1 Tax=Gluconacetobacter azotocaptans TaxID=142834 RepID=UPI0030B85279
MTPRGALGILVALGLVLAAGPARAVAVRVVDAATGRGIADATVVLGGSVLAMDGMGRVDLGDRPGRLFVRAPGYRAGAFAAGQLPPGAALPLVPFTPRALYLSSYGVGSATLRGAVLALIRDAGLNAVVVDIKGDRGLIPYPSAVALAGTIGARTMTTIPDLAALVVMLHARGLYAIARIVVFRDLPLAAGRPDLAVRQADGAPFRDRQGMAWADPFQPAVRAYNIDIAVEAARAGFDEIQFDYVRFPDGPERLRFLAPATQASRLAAISGFLAEARGRLLPYNVYLAADIFGYVCWNLDDTGIGQRLAELAPQVDYLSPMLYPSGFLFGIPGYHDPVGHPYDIVYRSLDMARRRLGISPLRFRPWLQAFRDYAFDRRVFGPAEIAAQIRAATDFGSNGWMLWNPRNVYDAAALGQAPSLP